MGSRALWERDKKYVCNGDQTFGFGHKVRRANLRGRTERLTNLVKREAEERIVEIEREKERERERVKRPV